MKNDSTRNEVMGSARQLAEQNTNRLVVEAGENLGITNRSIAAMPSGCAEETGLPGWPCETRTQKRRRKLSL